MFSSREQNYATYPKPPRQCTCDNSAAIVILLRGDLATQFYSAVAESIVLSSYAEALLDDAKSRYLEKISMIGKDPSTFGEQTDDVLPVDSCDLLSYLVLRISFITTERGKGWRRTTSSCVDG